MPALCTTPEPKYTSSHDWPSGQKNPPSDTPPSPRYGTPTS